MPHQIRTEVVFNHKRKSTIDSERLFRRRVRWRIKTDFVRLSRQTFIDLWCSATVLATMQGDVVATLV